jgi:hypothetical protein
MRIGGLRGVVLLIALTCAGCAGGYQAHRSTDETVDYYQPKPMASVSEAVKVFDDLKTFYSSGDGFHIQQTMADRTGVRFHESRTVTQQRQEDTVYHAQGLFDEDKTATTTKNVDVAQEHDAWIPADKVAGILVSANYVGFLYSDETFYYLQASDGGVARKLADAFATLQAVNYGPSSKFFPDSGLRFRPFASEEGQPMAQEYARLGWSQQTGVLIDGVAPNSPAATAGILTDDIIYEMNGKTVPFKYSPVAALNFKRIVEDELSQKPTATFDLRIFRSGQIVPAKLTLTNPIIGRATEIAEAARPARTDVPAAAKPSFGISARALTPAEAKNAGVSGGVFIGNVAEGSAAAKLGLQTGDYLLEINATKLADLEAMKPLLGGEVSSVVVWRSGKTITLGGLSSF